MSSAYLQDVGGILALIYKILCEFVCGTRIQNAAGGRGNPATLKRQLQKRALPPRHTPRDGCDYRLPPKT
jgi:hypothetical protein